MLYTPERDKYVGDELGETMNREVILCTAHMVRLVTLCIMEKEWHDII